MTLATEARSAELPLLRERLAAHPLAASVTSPAALRAFMERHVVCVLDFMSLLKSLQADLACAKVPWAPRADAEATRLVLEIVLDEEADRRRDGRATSHFAWYLEAMDEIGADAAPARALVERLAAGDALAPALAASALPPEAIAFGLATARALSLPLDARAAVFFHGREDVIPALFLPIVRELARSGLPAGSLIEYLERHVEVDSGDHGPRAQALLERLYGGDPERRAASERAAVDALRARERLWDAIVVATRAAG